MSCNCGPAHRAESSAHTPPPGASQVRYLGRDARSFRGADGRVYRFDALLRLRWIAAADLGLFSGREDFEVLEREPAPA